MASRKSKRAPQLETSEKDTSQSFHDKKGNIKGKRMKKDDSGINVIQENENSEECDMEADVASMETLGQNSSDSGNNGVYNLSHLGGDDLEEETASTSANQAACGSQSIVETIGKNLKQSSVEGNIADGAFSIKTLGQNNSNSDVCNLISGKEIKHDELEDTDALISEIEAATSCGSHVPVERENGVPCSSGGKDSSLRLSHRSFSSDSDSENSSDKADSNCESDHTYGKIGKAKPSDLSDKEFDPTPSTPKPRHKWNAPLAIAARQYGSHQNYSTDIFRYKCYGSLHMVERLELMDKMKRHDGCVNALNFNSTGTQLASGSDDLDIVVWDWTVGEPLFEYNSGHRSNVFQAKFMPLAQDAFIVSCGRDGQVRVGEISSSGECKKTRKLAQHKGAAHKLAVQMDSPNTFYSCGEDAAVFGIDLRKEKPNKLVICKSKEKKVPLYSIFVNPLKSFEYVVGGRSQFVKVYDTRCIRENDGFLKDLCPEHLVENDLKNVTSVVYNYNGLEILASYNDEDIYSFDNRDTAQSNYLHRYKGHRNSQTVKGVNYFGPKSEFVMSGSDCGYIFFWEKETEHIVKYMYGDEGGVVNCLEPNPVMPVLATSGLDDDIKIWVPSCETPPDLSGLTKHLIANMKEREEERRDCPEAFIDQTIWFLMQHLVRSRGRRASARDPVVEPPSSSDSDSQDEDEAEFRREVQCSQS